MSKKQETGPAAEAPFEEKVRAIVRNDPSVSAKFLPYLGEEATLVIPPAPFACPLTDADDGLPVPPQELWGGYWRTPAEYLESGKAQFRTMMEKLENSGFVLRQRERILDFGCGAGRIIRRFKEQAAEREIWGVDINDRHIRWCRENLCPPFKFLTTTTFPHLPFEDSSFDVIYAGSVFTHIADLTEAWLMELRRILKREGRMYVTVYDNHSIELLLSSPPDSWLHGTPLYEKLAALEAQRHFMKSGFSTIVLSRDARDSVVFYDIDFLRRSWGNFMRILFVDHEAFGYQTAIILGKPSFEGS
jgi:ubiquinone/menaquinone biosynthesis C-methylase UbiE